MHTLLASGSVRPAEYRIQNTESGRPTPVDHAVSTPFGGFCMLRQNTECAPDRPTCSFHAFWGILYAPAESRMRAGPSNMQFPHLLRDSVCCGRIQNAGRRMQGYWKTPTSAESKVFENTKSRPAVSISPPATSPHLIVLAHSDRTTVGTPYSERRAGSSPSA